MKIDATLHYTRIAPRKVRAVAGLIRGKRVAEAERLLGFTPRRAALPLKKLLQSAVSNARHNFQITESNDLVISEITIDGGPTLKRMRARARGRGAPIRKRTSHITIVLESRGQEPKKAKASKSEIAVVTEPGEKPPEERERSRDQFREPLKAPKKQSNFVQRIFRRKVI